MNFSPVVYEHAAAFLGKSPSEVSRSASLMAEAHIQAYRTYHHNPVTVGIDIYNLEAESWGGIIVPDEGNEVPSIKEPVFRSPADLFSLQAADLTMGRWPLILEAAGTISQYCPGADIRIPLSGPFSIAAHMTGFENLLMYSITEEDGAADLMLYLAGLQSQLARQILRAGYGVTFFESSATPPMLSPALFRSVVKPALTHILGVIREEAGQKGSCILGGDTAPVSGDLAEAGAGFVICPAETDQKLFLENIRGRDLLTRINMSAGIIASGDWPAIEREAGRVRDLMAVYEGTFAGSGVLPYNADPELIRNIARLFEES